MSADQLTEVLQPDIARFPRARLTVSKGPDKGLEVVLEGQSVTVGTDESCQLRLTDSSVSRRHFELSGGPGGYRLRDLRSTNGGLDANWMVKHGIPTVTFGAGQNEIHTVKEFVDLTEFESGCRLALALAMMG